MGEKDGTAGDEGGSLTLEGKHPEFIADKLLSLDIETQSKIFAAWIVGLERSNTATDLTRRMLRHRLQLSGRIAEKEIQTRLSGPASFGDRTTDELEETLQGINHVLQGLCTSVKYVEEDLGSTKTMMEEVHSASKEIKDKAIDVCRTAKAAELQGQRTERRMSTQSLTGGPQRASIVGGGGGARASITSTLPGLEEVANSPKGGQEKRGDEYEYDYVIIGGGVAAGYLCGELVKQGLEPNSLVILSSDTVLPYERTVLSKSYMHPPDARPSRLQLSDFYTTAVTGGELQDDAWYERHGITLVMGEQGVVSELDCQEKIVITEEGITYHYGKNLYIATGLRPLKPVDLQITGHDSQNIFVIRQEHEAGALVSRLSSPECQPFSERHVTVAGAGTLGVELAASIAGWGFQVSICFPEQRLIPSLFSDELSEVLEKKLKDHGVQILDSHFVTEFHQDPEDEAANVTVLLQGPGGVDDKVELPSCAVVVCVGSRVNSEILTGWCEFFRNGAKVDQDLRLEAYPEVFVLGDICAYPNPYKRSQYMRVEHFEHAKASAEHAARSTFAPPNSMPPYDMLPWFNSLLLEYSDCPCGWEFYGDEHAPDIAHFEYGNAGLGGFWIAQGHVAGACLIRSPPPTAEDLAKMRSIVQSRPRVKNNERIGELGLYAFDDEEPDSPTSPTSPRTPRH